ncbi:MAG: DNA polymerase IV [Christensenella sp.]|uniref:Y-family DNA polymerase n=1 Tax=Christensenella sp. TaxID=1935934 RepID=UPI002B1E96D9|nr:DNA polymerase IV [Christensenella sp.]MEA5003770.1 DNA polymerase IV [Christensenella sp.]
MERVILHVDMNNFYASVECLLNPKLRGHAVAVCGDEEKRHGIILAKNQRAKKAGVKTAEPIWQARQKCPGLVCVKARHGVYVKFSQQARQIFLRYSGRMEPFGLDEAWIDVSGRGVTAARGKEIGDEIRKVIRRELGITASVGVSYNKIFAKLGSDQGGPDATTVITFENFREKVWKLCARDLLYVGRSTEKKLERCSIRTIGDIARSDKQYLKKLLGKWGLMLWSYANGYDAAPVAQAGGRQQIKSIGNSTTTPRDLVSMDDVKQVLLTLSENVAKRLKKYRVMGTCVQISVRSNTLERMTRQQGLAHPTDLSNDLAEAACTLFQNNYSLEVPVRSIGVRATGLIDMRERQLDLFIDEKKIRAECAVEKIRERFGNDSLLRASVLREKDLAELEEGKRSIFPNSRL